MVSVGIEAATMLEKKTGMKNFIIIVVVIGVLGAGIWWYRKRTPTVSDSVAAAVSMCASDWISESPSASCNGKKVQLRGKSKDAKEWEYVSVTGGVPHGQLTWSADIAAATEFTLVMCSVDNFMLGISDSKKQYFVAYDDDNYSSSTVDSEEEGEDAWNFDAK